MDLFYLILHTSTGISPILFNIIHKHNNHHITLLFYDFDISLLCYNDVYRIIENNLVSIYNLLITM